VRVLSSGCEEELREIEETNSTEGSLIALRNVLPDSAHIHSLRVSTLEHFPLTSSQQIFANWLTLQIRISSIILLLLLLFLLEDSLFIRLFYIKFCDSNLMFTKSSRLIEQVNLFKVYYMHVWNCHNKPLLYY
jgi:hypothetical protein